MYTSTVNVIMNIKKKSSDKLQQVNNAEVKTQLLRRTKIRKRKTKSQLFGSHS